MGCSVQSRGSVTTVNNVGVVDDLGRRFLLRSQRNPEGRWQRRSCLGFRVWESVGPNQETKTSITVIRTMTVDCRLTNKT